MMSKVSCILSWKTEQMLELTDSSEAGLWGEEGGRRRVGVRRMVFLIEKTNGLEGRGY